MDKKGLIIPVSCAASGEVYVVLEPAASLDLITFTDPFAESFGHAALRYQRNWYAKATKLTLSKICEISGNDSMKNNENFR
jgi:hypothetical protein